MVSKVTGLTTEHFEGPATGDDQFMYSMISNYAMESADKDGNSTGRLLQRTGTEKAWSMAEVYLVLLT
jgi:hypothetical protein